MPNSRSDKKAIVSSYVDKQIKDGLVEQAESLGLTLTDLTTQLYIDYLKSKGVEIGERR